MQVLLSIKPEYVAKIFNGTKKYEYRKAIFKRENIKKVIVYSTMPEGKIVGEFEIERILQDDPCNLWEVTKDFGGVDEVFYHDYFRNRENAFAIKIKSTKLYEQPIDPKQHFEKFTAPQSFAYLREAIA